MTRPHPFPDCNCKPATSRAVATFSLAYLSVAGLLGLLAWVAAR
jgi:hypothetical protein